MMKVDKVPCGTWTADCKTHSKCLIDFHWIIQSVLYMKTFNSDINKPHFSFIPPQNISNKSRIYVTQFF